MIEKRNFVNTLCQKADKLETGQYLDIRSYKRNRSILLIKFRDHYRIIENGFRHLDININFNKLQTTLKTIERIEFPRSNKIRIYNMGQFDIPCLSMKRKKI